MYQLIVGEGGCSPDYFLNKMSVAEARDYIKGLNRRYRQNWEMTRLLGRLLVKVETGKDWDMDFVWEFEDNDKKSEPTDEELNELREKARIMEQIMNSDRKI